MKTKLINFLKKHKKVILKTSVLCLLLVLNTTNVYAEGDAGVDRIDKVVEFLCSWFKKIGLVVALVGGVQFGLAFKNDDANAKTNAIRMIAAGFMVFGVGAAPDVFMEE